MPKYEKVFKELRKQQKEVAKECRIDEPTMSKFVHGRVLPNKTTFGRICAYTKKTALDFYDYDEINLRAVGRSKRTSREYDIFYKITARLLREDCDVLLDEEKLRLCGYDSITHWLRACNARLRKRHEIIMKAREKK